MRNASTDKERNVRAPRIRNAKCITFNGWSTHSHPFTGIELFHWTHSSRPPSLSLHKWCMYVCLYLFLPSFSPSFLDRFFCAFFYAIQCSWFVIAQRTVDSGIHSLRGLLLMYLSRYWSSRGFSMNCTAVANGNTRDKATRTRPRRPTLEAVTSNGPFTLQLVQKPKHVPSLVT